MKANKFLLRAATGYVLFSCISVLSVSVMAFLSPQAVMDLVGTKLSNTDALSSIRGVYGGVGFTLVVCLLYTLRRNISESLGLLTVFWGFYAMSRTVTIFVDGNLGAFGTKWLLIETFFCLLAILLWIKTRRTTNVVPALS